MATCSLFDNNSNSSDSDEIKESECLDSTFGFDEKSERTDLMLLIECKTLHVSRMVLEMISPVFGEFISRHEGHHDKSTVRIQGKRYKYFFEFIACIYPGKKLNVSLENVHRILPLAYEFKVDDLKNQCENVLIDGLSKKGADDDFIVQCTCYGSKFKLPTLLQKGAGLLAKQLLENTELVDSNLKLDAKGKSAVYEAMMPRLRTESSRNRFFSASQKLKDYQRFDDAKYKQVDFELMHATFFAKEKSKFEIDIWNVKIEGNVKKKKCSNHVKTEIRLRHPKLSKCEIAVHWTIKNHTSNEAGIWYLQRKTMSTTDDKFPWLLTGELDFDAIKYQRLGFKLNGKYSISVHILMNKPGFA